MSQSLPYQGLHFNDIELDDVVATADDAEEGHIVECDLHFPQEIHDLLKEYPPCPENLAPEYEWLSDFQKQLLDAKQHVRNQCLI